jgi:hypothetical protein
LTGFFIATCLLELPAVVLLLFRTALLPMEFALNVILLIFLAGACEENAPNLPLVVAL